VFKEDIRLIKIKQNRQRKENDAAKTQLNWWEQYVILDPDNKLIITFKLVFMCSIALQFVLFPVTVFFDMETVLDITWKWEVGIDVMFIIDMLLSCITGTRKSTAGEIDRRWKPILVRYITNEFIFDVCSTLPGFFLDRYIDFYWFKLIRLARVSTMKKIIENLIDYFEVKFQVAKQKISKIQYFVDFFITLLIVMHSLACMMCKIGTISVGGWLDNPEDIRGLPPSHIYLRALYWVVTTLTTVGYGDIKGFTSLEYQYTMFVEFVGILFFSFIMGSI